MVEDEPAIRGVITTLLEDEGYVVEAARHGREALTKALRHRPDVVILDLMMPTMSGWELIHAWRADLTTRCIPLVVTSAAYPAPTAVSLGVHAFVRKPIDLERLLSILEALLDERT